MDYNAYHFTGATLRDGRPVPAIGETLVHDGEIEWCGSGLYFCRTAFQALQHAPGAMLHRVRVDDVEREDADKGVCRRRTIVATIDATDLLRDFARRCALDVIHLWDAPDVVRKYLETGDESLRYAAGDAAARDAARAARAAEDAAWTAAWAASDAAGAAARAAADAAGDAAARDAARAARAAEDAAWTAADAAWAAARAAADAAEDAWYAARAAADAAEDAWELKAAMFNKMVDDAFAKVQK